MYKTHDINLTITTEYTCFKNISTTCLFQFSSFMSKKNVYQKSNVQISGWNSQIAGGSCRKLRNWKISLLCFFKSDIELKKKWENDKMRTVYLLSIFETHYRLYRKQWERLQPSTYFPFLEPIPHLWILPGIEIVKLTLWTRSISKLSYVSYVKLVQLCGFEISKWVNRYIIMVRKPAVFAQNNTIFWNV